MQRACRTRIDHDISDRLFRRRDRRRASPRRQYRVRALLGIAFPYATMIENVSGSLVMGLIAGYFAFRSGGASQHWQLFLTTGILGGYTTFSAFSLDAVLLYERGALGLAALYVLRFGGAVDRGLMAGLALARQCCERLQAHIFARRRASGIGPKLELHHRLAGRAGRAGACRGRGRDWAWSAASVRRRSSWRRRGSTAPASRRSCPRGRRRAAPPTSAW